MGTVSNLFSSVRVYLNDTGGSLYSDSYLLTVLPSAYGFLNSLFLSRKINYVDFYTSALTVPANTVILNTVGGFPTNYINCITLYEKDNGAPDSEYSLINLLQLMPPNITPTTDIFYAKLTTGNTIQLNPATTIRQVKMDYEGLLTVPTLVTDIIPNGLESWLALKLVEIISMSLYEPELHARIVNMLPSVEHELLQFVTKPIAVRRQMSLPFAYLFNKTFSNYGN